MAQEVEVKVVFNPDTKQLEKRTTEITEKNKVKIKFEKPDVKELEGPFKELQEKAMAMANGGFAKGLGQLKEGVSEFGNILKGGGDVSTALAGGLSKVGMEGATAFAAVGAGAVAAGAAFVALYDKGTQLSNTFQALGISFEEYTSALNGAVNAEQAFAIRNAARAVGLQLTSRQLAEMSNVTDTLAQRSGDLQGTQSLITQALQGNKEAMYQLGIQYSETDTEIQRATRSLDELSKRSRELGPKNLGFFEQVGIGFGRISEGAAVYLNSVSNEYASLVRTQAESEQIAQRSSARRAEDSRQESQRLRDSQNRSAIEAINLQQQERTFALATNSLLIARDGESTAQQLLRSEMESLNIQGQINRIREITGGSEKEQLARRAQIADLERREAAEISKRNQLQSFSVQLADAQRTRLVQMALAQVNNTGHAVKQLSLADQLKMAERERARIVAAIALANGNITEAQRQQLEGLQTFINQGRAQQAQGSDQITQLLEQNRQAILRLRIENELRRAQGLTTDASLAELDVQSQLVQAQNALNNLNIGSITNARELENRLKAREMLIQRISGLQDILNARETQYTRNREAALSIERQRIAFVERQTQAGIAQVDIVSRAIDSQFTLARAAMERARTGERLTESESQALARYNDLLIQRNQITALDQVRLNVVQSQLTNTNLNQEERNRLLQEEISLRERIASRQREDIELNKQQQGFTSRSGKALEGLAGSYSSVGDAMDGLAAGAMQNFSGAFSNLITTAIEGKTSFGDAMLEMTRSVLTSLSQQALVQGLAQLALGFARLAVGDTAGSTAAFTSAGLYAAVGAAAGIGAGFIPKPASESSGGSGGSSGGSSVSGASVSTSDNKSMGPTIINFNMRPFETKETIEDSVGALIKGFQSRR